MEPFVKMNSLRCSKYFQATLNFLQMSMCVNNLSPFVNKIQFFE